MKLTVPPGQIKIVIPLLGVLLVALTMTVVRTKGAMEQNTAPPGQPNASAPVASPEQAAELAASRHYAQRQRSADAGDAPGRNPFDAPDLKPELPAGLAQMPGPVGPLPGAPKRLPPARIDLGGIKISAAAQPAHQGASGSTAAVQPVEAPPDYRLTAIIESGGSNVAIITTGSAGSAAVRQGQTLESGYRVVHIGEGSVRLSSPGRAPIRLTLPGSGTVTSRASAYTSEQTRSAVSEPPSAAPASQQEAPDRSAGNDVPACPEVPPAQPPAPELQLVAQKTGSEQ